jgi:hypothetical protein
MTRANSAEPGSAATHRYRRRPFLKIRPKAIDWLRELLSYLAPSCDPAKVAGPPQFLDLAPHDARRSRTVPSPTSACVHNRRILTRDMHDTAPVVFDRFITACNLLPLAVQVIGSPSDL